MTTTETLAFEIQALREQNKDLIKENRQLRQDKDTLFRMLNECKEAFRDEGQTMMAEGIEKIMKNHIK